MKFGKSIIKSTFRKFGLDIIRLNKNSEHLLLGMRNLPIRTITDVGANKGQFASIIQKVFPEANIYCFEPVGDAFKELDRWARSRNGKVEAFNFALGDFEGEIEIFYHSEHSPSSSILKTTQVCESLYPVTKNQRSIKVQQTTLDKAVDNFNIPLTPEILIKLDVQGYEDRVIRGGKKIFDKAKACILEVCLDQLYNGQATFKEITELLCNIGFRYTGNLDQSYADDGHVIFIDTVFVKS